MPGRKTTRLKAIVLDRTKLAEQDLILTMLSDSGEERRAVAKGARKPGGRFAARVELFCELDVLLAEGRSLDILSEATLLEPHASLRGDLSKVAAASAICEVARLSCIDGVEDAFLYPLLSRALRACEEVDDEKHLDLVVAAYVFKVLAHEGWRPELESCIACGDEALTYFSPAAGGALCGSCAHEIEGAIEVTPLELSWLSSLLKLTFDQLVVAEIAPETALFLFTSAHIWAATHLEARLKAFEFLLSI